MSLRTCAVTFTDSRGVKHTAEVATESLFEAAVLGMQILKRDGWIQETFGAATKIHIEVREPATSHTVTIQQIERWLSGATISPNERVKKDRLRTLLKESAASSRRG